MMSDNHLSNNKYLMSSSLNISNRYLIITTVFTLSASLIWGVNTLFLLDSGLDIFQVFIANAVYSAASAVFEVPTGVLADTRGRRFSLALGALVLAAGTMGYMFAGQMAHPLLWFVVMSVLIGLGYSFMSGSLEAWLVDALQFHGQGGQMDRVMARGVMANNVAMLVGSIGGGILGDISLSLPFAVRAGLLLILFGLVVKLVKEFGFTPQTVSWRELPQAMRRTGMDGMQFGWRHRSVRQLMMVAFVQGAFMLWGFYAWQPYLLKLWGEQAVWLSGLIAALNALAGFLGAALVGQLAYRMHRRSTALIVGLSLQALCSLMIGMTSSFYVATGALIVMMAATGFMAPMRQAYLNNLIPSNKRATVLSFDSLVSNAGATAGGPALGYVDRAFGTQYGYMIGAVLLAMGVPMFVRLRRFKDVADDLTRE
jgi:MFS family permease